MTEQNKNIVVITTVVSKLEVKVKRLRTLSENLMIKLTYETLKVETQQKDTANYSNFPANQLQQL